MIIWKDIVRPISGLIFIQPFIILWLIFTNDDPIGNYAMIGWGLQVYITCILIPYYAWFEYIWPIHQKKYEILNKQEE